MREPSPLHPAVVRRSAAIACIAVGLFLGAPAWVRAQTSPGVTAARATVYIRLLGDLEVVRPADPLSPERRMEASDVELSTGSGVLISPVGYVLTAAHVVSAENGKLTLNGVRVEVKPTVRHIEVLLPPDESGGPAPTPLDATILAIDPALDLAVLSVGGANLPFLDLGDSDGLAIGDPVEAIGFPFGDQVEIGRPRTALTGAPAPSVSRGNLAAFRGDDQGDRRFLQLTASLNPGNSGGPVVDADGYLVAVANSVMRSRAGVGTGVGFGVSVNLVKRFLEGHGFDSSLRARRMTAGSLTSLEGKAIRVAMPIGMSDTSPLRTRVDTGGQSVDGVTLRIDRVLSAWPAVRIAESLTAGRGFESFAAATTPPPSDAGGGRLFLGRATGTQADGTPVRLEYAVAQVGEEKIVARFVGPPHQLAYNASIVRAALKTIEVDPLRAPARGLAAPAAWAPRAVPRGNALDRVPLPAAWIVEPAGPLACAGVQSPADAVSASPAGDFAVALRAGWITAAAMGPQQAAAACGTPAADDQSSYAREFAFLGTRYVVQGRFAAADGGGLVQLEWSAPADQAAAARALFAAWLGR